MGYGTDVSGFMSYPGIVTSVLHPGPQDSRYLGFMDALDVATGNILGRPRSHCSGATDTGSVSVANGVMYAGPIQRQMYALDTTTGNILWNFAAELSNRWPSIVDSVLYWGSGYRNIPPGIGNNSVRILLWLARRIAREHSDDQEGHSQHEK